MTKSSQRLLIWAGAIALGGAFAQSLIVAWRILNSDHRFKRWQFAAGETYFEQTSYAEYIITHTVENGIERIIYTPAKRRHQTPILLLHGMWHGAWCWQLWQAQLAALGWESIAFSLPGHGLSPTQRPIMACTLAYYLSYLRAEVERLPIRPILMGHSMGGALTQWYLKKIGDDLPAAVLVAPWGAFDCARESMPSIFLTDPFGMIQSLLTNTATPLMRSPESAARLLLSPNARCTPQELHTRLGPESALVTLEHRPPFWSPPVNLRTPMLILAGESDVAVPLAVLQRAARHYQADLHSWPGAAHNLMYEPNAEEIATAAAHWLEGHNIP